MANKKPGKYHKPKFCKYSILEMLKELRREQDMRENVYKRKIRNRNMEKSTAVKRWHLLNDCMKVLEAYNRRVLGEQTALFEDKPKNKMEPED